MRRSVLVYAMCLVGLLLALALPGCVAGERWGPFRGQVVDVETGQPIGEAVVLVIWWKVIPNPAGGWEEFYDAREAVTDAGGGFEVPRWRPPVFRLGIQPPTFTVFAAGYQHVGTVVTPGEGERFVAPTVVQMRRMQSRGERIEYQHLFPPSIPFERMPRLLEALNQERRSLGFEPFGKTRGGGR